MTSTAAPPSQPTYIWYVAVFIAVAAMSWGGPLIVLVTRESSPLMTVFWRLTATSILMVPGLLKDYKDADTEIRQRWKRAMLPLIFNGVVLALHFMGFSLAISKTSFSNAMLLVATTPMLLVAWTGLIFGLWKVFGGAHASKSIELVQLTVQPDGTVTDTIADWTPQQTVPPSEQPSNDSSSVTPAIHAQVTPQNEIVVRSDASSSEITDKPNTAPVMPVKQPSTFLRIVQTCAHQVDAKDGSPLCPTRYECLGSLIAFAGICVLILGKSDSSGDGNHTEQPATIGGDLLCLFTVCMYAVYLLVGSRFRKWMPLWLYSFPVFTSAAVTAALFVWMVETPSIDKYFAWLSSGRAFGLTLAIGFVPGILGHTLGNMALRRINPLVLSVTQLLQPLFSGFYGYMLGIQDQPGLSTLLAAPLLLFGIATVILGSQSGLKALAHVKWCRFARGKA